MSLEEAQKGVGGEEGGEAGSINSVGTGEGGHCKDFGFHSE